MDKIEDDLIYVMSTIKGRRFIWELMGLCGKGRQPFVVGAPDATNFNCGKIDVAIQLEAMADPDLYVLMTKEAKEKIYERPTDDHDDGNPLNASTSSGSGNSATSS